ncbi:RICIN domain-containing protein [Kitasatospora phosalacinea]|uniref:RICIN domain-containing protein n=1 Tax=Kitasatospora phosalacinea TaxID=2065 RepID=UPI0035E29E20
MKRSSLFTRAPAPVVVVAAIGMALSTGLSATAAPVTAAAPGTVATQAGVGAQLTAAAADGGCGKAPSLASGARTITSSGRTRSYILQVPADYDQNRPYRLVFGFHWRGGTAADVDSGGTDGYDWSYCGLRRLADADGNGTVFVAPQGFDNGSANSDGQDVTFVDDLTRQLEAGLCVDATGTGTANGTKLQLWGCSGAGNQQWSLRN